MQLVCCQQCDRVLDEYEDDKPIPTPVGAAECPGCGPTTRRIKPATFASNGSVQSQLVAHKPDSNSGSSGLSASDSGSVSEGIVIEKHGSNTEGIRIEDGMGQSVTIDMDESGKTASHVRGRSPQHEEGNLDVARILIERLNHDGARWGQPRDVSGSSSRGEQGVDCDASDGATTLLIQVTRAVDYRFWAPLGRTGQVVEAASTPGELADRLKVAIDRKVTLAGRSDIVLALNARLAVMQALHRVVDEFKMRHGAWARDVGFKAIWVVGPTVGLTRRLDE
jgi:hypothetical protein